jgi:hypothetical protein
MAQLGDIVLYVLDETDAGKINAWRGNFRAFNADYAGHKHPHKPGTPGATGHVAHTGLDAAEGDVLPAMVVSAPGQGRLGLKVFLHGNDEFWAVSVPEGTGPGTWTRRGGTMPS